MEQAVVIMNEEQRTLTRVPFEHHVRWLEARGENGIAIVRNVGRGGLCLSLGRYLRPGRAIQLIFNDILHQNDPVKCLTRVAWCRPIGQGSTEFAAGLRVIHDEPVTLAAISEVFYAALDRFREDVSAGLERNLS